MRGHLIPPLLFACVALLCGCATRQDAASARESQPRHRADSLRGVLATYCRPPRMANGRVDVEKLVSQLVDCQANTYSFCIHQGTNDWEDFQLFLPLARKHGIKAWGSVVPPSESPPRTKLYAEPFRLDYDRWAVEFARLSLRQPNLVAWSIDDFSHNLKVYTPEHLKAMMDASRAINPKLAFVPCCYFKEITAQFATNYCPLLDGILFPYRHESGGSDLKDPSAVQSEVLAVKKLTGADFPILVDIYATAHSRLGATTPEYVRAAMVAGRECADGVMVYCHQDPVANPVKYGIVKDLFTRWSVPAKPHTVK